MRRAVSVLAPFTVLAGAVFACENDPNATSGPDLQLDGSTPAFDGGQQGFDSSTPTPDATPDAPAGPPSVTVTVLARSGPKANVRVVFHDAAGAVLETKMTDATGKAKSTGALPAMASALVPKGNDRHIVTWTGIENGDDLVVRAPDDADEMLGVYNVSLPALLDGAGRYDVYAGNCWGMREGTNAVIELYPSCVTGNTSAVLVRAFDIDNQMAGTSFKKANAVPNDGSAVAVTTGQWAAPTTVTVTATNIPERPVNVDLLEIADGDGFADGFSHPLDNGSATFRTATGFADALQANLYVSTSPGATQMLTKRAAPSTTITFDASQLLPAIEGANLDGSSNLRRPVVSWSSSSTAGADGGLVRLYGWGEQENQYTWTIVVPPGSTNVSAPALPTDADEFLPSEDIGSMGWLAPEVAFIEADVLPSYKEFRAQHGTLAPAGTSFVFGLPTLPMNGTFRASGYVLTN